MRIFFGINRVFICVWWRFLWGIRIILWGGLVRIVFIGGEFIFIGGLYDIVYECYRYLWYWFFGFVWVGVIFVVI
jgi:hypothetical protein